MKRVISVVLVLLLQRTLAWSGEADVIDVKVSGSGPNYRFDVTVQHADTGWDHYTDGWEVIGEDGKVFGKRILHHPHVEEQPFTRSGNATVPEGIKTVIIRAHDSMDGYGGKEMRVDLPGR